MLQYAKRRWKRIALFLFLFLFLPIGIGIYFSMDSGHSLEVVSKLQTDTTQQQPESKIEEIEKNDKNIKEQLSKLTENVVKDTKSLIDMASEQATDLFKNEPKKEPETSINNTETNEKKEKDSSSGIFDYWWSVLIVIWFISRIFSK